MCGISAIRGHKIHYRCLKTSVIIFDGSGSDHAAAESAFPTAVLLCRLFLAQSSFRAFRNEISFMVFIYFNFIPYFCYWYLQSSDKEVGVFCWKCFRYSCLFYWSQSRNSKLYCTEKCSSSAISFSRPGWVIKMTTTKLNYYFYK
jgi:hypothetical protein